MSVFIKCAQPGCANITLHRVLTYHAPSGRPRASAGCVRVQERLCWSYAAFRRPLAELHSQGAAPLESWSRETDED